VTDHVYHARFLSEDTNPWDGNESYGVWGTLEDAQGKAFANFTVDDDEIASWVNVDWNGKPATTYTGHGQVETWERVVHKPGEDPTEMTGEGYGMFIFKEPLR